MKKIINWCINQIKLAYPLHLDHVGVCLSIVLFGWVLYFLSEKIGLFDPIKAAFDDFFTTDVYYDIIHSERPAHDDDIVIVDMTKLSSRDEIARVITDIKSCKPKLLCIDLIFERPSFDALTDTSLLYSLKLEGCRQVLPCKLRDYNDTTSVFRNCLYSFFHKMDFKNINWGYSNYRQIRMGGRTRETSLYQRLNDSIVYSLPYTVACLYQDMSLKMHNINERQIRYDDIDFDTIGCNDVLRKAEKIKGRLVILGTLHEEADMHFTPIGKMAGVKVLAYSIRTFIKGGEIKESGKIINWIIAILVWWLAACVGYWIEKRHPIVFAIIAKIFNFTLGAFLIWISFEVYAKYNYNIKLLVPLLGLAMVEDIRQMYAGIMKWLQDTTHWRIFNKSLYKKDN